MQRYLHTLRVLIAAVIIFLAFAYILLLVVVLGSNERWDDDPEQEQRAEAAAVVDSEKPRKDEAGQASVAVTKTARQATPLYTWPPQEALDLQNPEPELSEERDDQDSGSTNLSPSS